MPSRFAIGGAPAPQHRQLLPIPSYFWFLAILNGWFAYLTAENAKNSWENRIVLCAFCVLCG
jgi:hypothetical protein